jgi:hypothetical protein
MSDRDDGRIAARAVERHLDRQHRRVGRGVLQEFHHAGEALVGMMQQHVLMAHDFKIIAPGGQRGGDHRDVGFVAQGSQSASIEASGMRWRKLSGPLTG